MPDATAPPVDLLSQLVHALERRPSVDERDRAEHDEATASIAARAGRALLKPLHTESEAPPRRVGVAFVLALLSAPHFVATLQRPQVGGTLDPKEPQRHTADLAPVVSTELIERVFGIAAWEVDELREEVDRRAGRALKLTRTVNWLWSYFNLSVGSVQTLARILLPGTEDRGLELVRRGGHLYLLTDVVPAPPLAAMYLPWLAPDPNVGPAAFKFRGVDMGLRNRIARGIGADDDEVGELLDSMVCVLPREASGPYLQIDQWRTHGYAAVTDLGIAYGGGDWLTRPIPADGADWRAWLKVGDTGLQLRGTPERVFDALALPRASAMVRLLYAAMLASLDRDGRTGPEGVTPHDVDLYDVPRHLRACMHPLLAWAARAETHKHIAQSTGRSLDEVTLLLDGVHAAWIAHAQVSWFGPPGTRTPSIQTLVLEHIVTLHQAMRRLARREGDARGEHHDLLLLFVAHFLRDARLERLWLRPLSDCVDKDDAAKIPPPEDVASFWFWRTWQRLLDEFEHEGGGGTGY